MADQNIDAFILSNEKEDAVENIVQELDSTGISTYSPRRRERPELIRA